MTVRKEQFIVPDDARQLTYQGEDYAQSLARIFSGAISREDILSSLGMPWTKIASGAITTGSDSIIFKNFSPDYLKLYIRLYGLLVDSATSASLSLRTSTDNGVNFTSTASSYVFARRNQSTHASTTLASLATVSTSIILLDGTTTNHNLKSVAANGEHATVDLFVGHPLDSTRPTTISWALARGDTSGNFVWGIGQGSRGALEANNAIQVFTDASRTFTAGFYDMYGLRRAN